MSKDTALGCCSTRCAGVATLAVLRVCDVDECTVVVTAKAFCSQRTFSGGVVVSGVCADVCR
jgi:hypothetical protein